MHTLIVFFTFLFSMSHAASIRHSLSTQTVPTTELTPSRIDIAQLRSGSVYAGTGCLNCRRTNVTYTTR